MNKKFKIVENIYNLKECRYVGVAEVVFSYPIFQSEREGLDYIYYFLDPNYTGKYGIVTEE